MATNSKNFSQSISIIFPAYNEEKNIEGTIGDALSFAKENFNDFEIIVVNDGSRDKTLEIAQKIAQSEKNVKVINNVNNLGYGATVWKGLKAAKKDLIFFSDADRQFDLKEISRILDKIDKFDVVIGCRSQRKDPFIRKVNAYLWKILIRSVINLKVRDVDCAFKLFKKEVIDKIKVKSTGATFSAELIYQIKKYNFAVLEIAVSHYPRLEGKPTGAKFSVIKKALVEFWRFYLSEPVLVKAKSQYVYWSGAILLFLSRILLMSNSSDFFDANEYRWRTVDPNLLKAMTTGHAPYHPLYILFSNIIYKAHVGEVLATTLPAVIFGSLSIIVLFIIIKKLFSSRIAWLSIIIYAFLPFTLISQITILIDPVEHFFFFSSILFLISAWDKKWLKFCIFASLSGISLSLAALAHTQVGFWVLIFPGIILLLKPKFNRETWLKILIGAVLVGVFATSAIVIYAKLLLYGEPLTPLGIYTFRHAVRFLLFDNISEKSALSISTAFARLNFLSTTLVAICAVGGVIVMIKRDWVKLFGLLIWIFPAILTASYIHENLYGRAMVLALIPISILASIFILRLKKFSILVFLVVLAQILFISLPIAIIYRTKEAPNESLATFERQSDSGGVFIASNITRTWNAYNGKFVSFGDVGTGAGTAFEEAENALLDGKKAYLSSDAIYYPVWRYDGENFDFRARNLGGPGDHHTTLDEIFTKANVTLERASDDFKQAIYRITNSPLENKYQNIEKIAENKPVAFGRIMSGSSAVKDLTVNLYNDEFCLREKEDMTRNDIGACLYRELTNSKSASNWSATDRDGWFYIANEVNNPRIIVAPIPVSTRSDSLGVLFAAGNEQELIVNNSQTFDDINKLQQATDKINGSFYVIAKSGSGRISYQLNSVNFTLEKTNRIEAETMGGEFGDVVKEKTASLGQVRTNKQDGALKSGYMLSGPYIDLPKGKYKINFSLFAKKIVEENATVTLDVTSASSGEGFGTKEFKASDFTGKFTTAAIDFELSSDTKSLEFRVKTDGWAEVLADYIELDKL